MELIKRENPPNVAKFKGKDSFVAIGFTELFRKPMTKAAIKAEGKFAMSTPGTTKSTISRLKAVATAVNNISHIFMFPTFFT
jgi:uncharacterized membrane protein